SVHALSKSVRRRLSPPRLPQIGAERVRLLMSHCRPQDDAPAGKEAVPMLNPLQIAEVTPPSIAAPAVLVLDRSSLIQVYRLEDCRTNFNQLVRSHRLHQ